MAQQRKAASNGATLGFEETLWAAAEYKHAVLGLIFMLEPYTGRVYDPCCDSGGMFVQSEEFAEAHGGHRYELSTFGDAGRTPRHPAPQAHLR